LKLQKSLGTWDAVRRLEASIGNEKEAQIALEKLMLKTNLMPQ
jgi:hypothetical protein